MGLAVLIVDLMEGLEDDPVICYEQGTVEEGMAAMEEVLKAAQAKGVPIYGVDYAPQGNKTPLSARFRGYVPDDHYFTKGIPNAFFGGTRADGKLLRTVMNEDATTEVILIGFDRDDCILETAVGGTVEEYRVITSEALMLSRNNKSHVFRPISLNWLRGSTTYHETAEEVLDYLRVI